MLTQEYIKTRYSYNPETGVLAWRGSNKPVGSDSHGHLLVAVNGKNYLVHRLIWLYMEGYFPEHLIDHINGNGHDNRWANLRAITHSCNAKNRGKLSPLNTSGFVGVSWNTKSSKWIVTGHVNKKKYYLGGYYTLQEAARVRIAFERAQPDYDCNRQSLNEKKFVELGYAK